MISTDADILITLLDQEFSFYLSQREPKRQLLLLPRLVGWLEREPRLGELLQEMRLEAQAAAERYQTWRSKMHSDLGAQWAVHGDAMRRLLQPFSGQGQLSALGRLEEYAARCQEPAEMIPCSKYPERDRSSAHALIRTLQHWLTWARQVHEREAGDAPPHELEEMVGRSAEFQEYEFRAFQAACASLGGAAMTRLGACVARSRIEPAAAELSEEEHAAWLVEHMEDVDFARALYTPGAELVHDDGRTGDPLEDVASDSRNDASLLFNELRQRVLLGWSRQSIVRRYAARCQAFDAARLREVAAAETRKAEDELTRDFARYLFDQGLTPLLNVEIGRLRPDVIDIAGRTTFYVEAKQYSERNPRSMLLKAYQQVWSTWGRLRAQYTCPEAFLVVFRRSGPRVELPAELRFTGLILHSVLIDISADAGSTEKQSPIEFAAHELLPQREESTIPVQ
jgi:hypothetical protein